MEIFFYVSMWTLLEKAQFEDFALLNFLSCIFIGMFCDALIGYLLYSSRQQARKAIESSLVEAFTEAF